MQVVRDTNNNVALCLNSQGIEFVVFGIGITQVFRYSLGGANLWGIAVFVGKEGNVLNMLIGVAIGVAVAFIAVMILYRPENAVAE